MIRNEPANQVNDVAADLAPVLHISSQTCKAIYLIEKVSVRHRSGDGIQPTDVDDGGAAKENTRRVEQVDAAIGPEGAHDLGGAAVDTIENRRLCIRLDELHSLVMMDVEAVELNDGAI